MENSLKQRRNTCAKITQNGIVRQRKIRGIVCEYICPKRFENAYFVIN